MQRVHKGVRCDQSAIFRIASWRLSVASVCVTWPIVDVYNEQGELARYTHVQPDDVATIFDEGADDKLIPAKMRKF